MSWNPFENQYGASECDNRPESLANGTFTRIFAPVISVTLFGSHTMLVGSDFTHLSELLYNTVFAIMILAFWWMGV